MKEICSINQLDASVTIPGSKSVTHRALIAAGLADGRSELTHYLGCEDTFYTIEALRAFGISLTTEKDQVIVMGNGGNFTPTIEQRKIFLGNSGTTFRFIMSIAALTGSDVLLTGTPRMKERPIGELMKALGRLGVGHIYLDRRGFPPVLIMGKGIKAGKVNISGEVSSQYISSLLLAGPYADGDVEIVVTGKLVSKPYVDITMDVMQGFGVHLENKEHHYFRIPGNQTYKARPYRIPGDASTASYFWAAAAVTGGRMVTKNIYPDNSRQGDIALLEILEEMGCLVERGDDHVTVQGGRLSAIEVDMRHIPDMVPTLAVIGLFAEGRTIIQNVPHLRDKESDRLHAISVEIRRLGGHVEEFPDGVIVSGGKSLTGAMIDPHNDHRIAMSLAVVGLVVPGIKIKDETCVNKSCPNFWDLWDSLTHSPAEGSS